MEKEPNSIKIFTKVKLELSMFHPEILAFYEEMIISFNSIITAIPDKLKKQFI